MGIWGEIAGHNGRLGHQNSEVDDRQGGGSRPAHDVGRQRPALDLRRTRLRIALFRHDQYPNPTRNFHDFRSPRKAFRSLAPGALQCPSANVLGG